MSQITFADDKPRVLFKAKVDRKLYRQRFRRALIGVLATIGVWVMLQLPQIQTAISELTWLPDRGKLLVNSIGLVVAGGLLLAMAVRLVVNGVLMTRRKSEQVIFYDRGFKWKRGEQGETQKYGWNAIKTVREHPTSWGLFGRKWIHGGHVTFTMRNGETYRLTPAHGSLETFIQRVSPHYTANMGERMMQRTRQGHTITVHPQIKITSAGLVISDKWQIEWKRLKVEHDGQHVTVRYIDDSDGRIRNVKRFAAHEINNLGAFLDVVESATETTQRTNLYG